LGANERNNGLKILKPVYILESVRTPRAKAKDSGSLHDLNPFELLDTLYKFYSTNQILDPESLEEIILGCVTQHGEQAGNIAKSSVLYSNYPDHVSGLTINRFCSSSLDAINIGYLKIASGQNNVVMAGGIEMMSRVPMLSDQAAIWTDVKTAIKSRIFMMGSGADLIASINKITRLEADTQAFNSQQKAVHAQRNKHFKSIVPVFNPHKDIVCKEDECIRAETTIENLSALKPSFEELGNSGVDNLQLQYFSELSEIAHIHTAGNSPAMSDAASMTLLSSSNSSASSDYKSRGIIKGVSVVNADPLLVLSGCIEATKQLLIKSNLTIKDIDLFEIHEAFASTIILAQRELRIPEGKLNVNGGCIALGHPMGATGSIMLSSLLDEMERQDLSIGIVATSGAAGAGTALLIQR
jgi:acetyl-CoA C-acetyltransferase